MSEEVLVLYDKQFGTEFYLFQIEGYPKYYVEPIYGRIWSTKREGQWLKGRPIPRGYLKVDLRNGKYHGFYIHTLIYKTIYGYDLNSLLPDNLSIDHIDRDKLNNSISNLRLATKMEQTYNSPRPTKIVAFKNGKSFGPFQSISECARQLGLPIRSGVTCICRTLRENTTRHHVGGYTFKEVK